MSIHKITPFVVQDRRKLVIDDLPGDTVEELLKYIYTDSSHNVEAFSQTLLAASDKYKVSFNAIITVNVFAL